MDEESKKYKFYVAGVQHHDIYKVEKILKEEDFLSMVLEPSNQYDPNAVRLEFRDVMIGYVPRTISADIAALIMTDEGLWSCKIVELKWDEKSWKQVKVSIEEVSWKQADCSAEAIEEALEKGDYIVEGE